MRLNQILGLLLGAALSSSSVATSFNPPPFPRLGALLFGSASPDDSPALQATVAKTSIALFGYWPGWETTHTETFQQAMAAIKALNPNIQLSVYSQIDSVSSNPTYAAVVNKLNTQSWWLYQSGTSGAPVPNFYTGGDGPFYQINTTLFPAPDSGGHRFMDWFAAWYVTNMVTPNPALNSAFIDNVFVQPMATGDWNLDGVSDSPSTPLVGHWVRLGYNAYFSSLRALMPNANLIGNIGSWGQATADLTDYQGQLNGGLIEGLVGYSWSPESWGGWQELMSEYRKAMGALAAPKLAMFAMIGSPTDYQSLRYGLASCMMDDGYFTFDSSSSYNDVPWFDEYNANLGAATSSPSTSAWHNGVYRRDFQNGIALVNPKGNGPQTVKLETSYKRINGSQDPSVNNGQTVTTVTLQDRDGLILMRLTPIGVPLAPSNLTLTP
jgi:Hypothetical glycosyl hydrolase family 15